MKEVRKIRDNIRHDPRHPCAINSTRINTDASGLSRIKLMLFPKFAQIFPYELYRRTALAWHDPRYDTRNRRPVSKAAKW